MEVPRSTRNRFTCKPCCFWVLTFCFSLFLGKEKAVSQSLYSFLDSSRANYRTLALIVGISKYKSIDTLRFAHLDAISFKDYLTNGPMTAHSDNNVLWFLNEQATSTNLLDSFDQICQEARENDNVIIYFSGHGGKDESRIDNPGYLLTHETHKFHYASTSVPIVQLASTVSTLSVKKKAKVYLFVDACRAGRLAGTNIGEVRLLGHELAQQLTCEVKVFACQYDEVSYEGDEWGSGHGAFTHFLLKGLQGEANTDKEDENITLYELEQYLKKNIRLEGSYGVGIRQTPFKVGNDYHVMARSLPRVDLVKGNVNKPILGRSGAPKSLAPEGSSQTLLNNAEKKKSSNIATDTIDIKKRVKDEDYLRFENSIRKRDIKSSVQLYTQLKSREDWAINKRSVEKRFVSTLSEFLNEQIGLYYDCSENTKASEIPTSLRQAFEAELSVESRGNDSPKKHFSNLDTLRLVVSCVNGLLPGFERTFLANRVYSHSLFFMGMIASSPEVAKPYYRLSIGVDSLAAHAYFELGCTYFASGQHFDPDSLTVANTMIRTAVRLAPRWTFAKSYSLTLRDVPLIEQKLPLITHRESSGASYFKGSPKEVPINLTLKNVTVREFNPPFKILPVLVEKDVSRYPLFEITEQTIFKKDKKNALPLGQLKQGMRVVVTIDYLQLSNRAIAKEIQLDPGYYGNTTLEGIFEDVVGDRALVDGHVVTMGKDRKIKGAEGWKGKEFISFADMQLGSLIKLRGKRELDGVIHVESGIATPVLMAEDDRMLRKGMSLVVKVDLNEIKIGNKRSIPIESDPALHDYIATLGEKLIPEYIKSLPLDHPDRIDFRFYLAKDETVNAVALPDGVVLINTGLLKVLKNEAQLSAVVGHEIAHVLYKHHTAKMRNTNDWNGVPLAAGIVATGIYGSDAGFAVGMMTEVVSKMAMNSFSRKKESQADRIGLYYMVNAGYDPREAASFWQGRLMDAQQKIDETQMKAAGQALALSLTAGSELADDEDDKEADSEESVSAYDPTHPKLRDRFNNLNFLLATTYSSLDYKTVKTGEDEYARFLQKLLAREKGIDSVKTTTRPPAKQPSKSQSSKSPKPASTTKK